MDFDKKHQRSLAVVLTIAAGLPMLCQAIEPQDILAPTIGPVVVLPSIGVSQSYTDNVFLSSESSPNLTPDHITSFSPGIGLEYGEYFLDSNYITFDYKPTFLSYKDQTELNTDNHLLNFNIQYIKQGKFSFQGSDRIALDNNLLTGSETSFFSAFSDNSRRENKAIRVERLSISDNYRFDYFFTPKTGIYFATRFDSLDYQNKPHYYRRTVFGDLIPYSLYDISTWQNAIGLGWKALPKITFFGGAFYGTTYVESNLKTLGDIPDSNINGGQITATGTFSEKLSGSVMIGYQVRKYDYLDDHKVPISEVNLTYKYSEKGEAKIGYRRGGYVSPENPNWAVEQDFITLNMNQNIGTSGKWSARIESTFQLDNHSQESLEYRYFRSSLNLSYAIRPWAGVSLGYGFDSFDAVSTSSIDYRVNTVTLGLSVGY